MKIDYIKHGDICLPALKVPEGTYEIGRFGRMYLDHIKKNRRVVYSQLMIKGTLLKHVSQIGKHAIELSVTHLHIFSLEQVSRECEKKSVKLIPSMIE